MSKLPTNVLMDAFKRYCEAIRKVSPQFTRFKDGNLIKHGLRHLSEFQVEMLFLWFLKEKKHMRPTIGAALSKGIIGDFIDANRREYGFYNKLEQLAKLYAGDKKTGEEIKTETMEMIEALEKLKAELAKKVRPFNYQTRAKIAEETAAMERKKFTPTP
jgi:hypothetical protein